MSKRRRFWQLPWTRNRLASRKLALATLFVAVAIGVDVAGHPLASSTLSAVQNVLLAYIGITGILDYREMKSATDWLTGQATAMPDSVDPAGGDC
jgi:hypothetical protein